MVFVGFWAIVISDFILALFYQKKFNFIKPNTNLIMLKSRLPYIYDVKNLLIILIRKK